MYKNNCFEFYFFVDLMCLVSFLNCVWECFVFCKPLKMFVMCLNLGFSKFWIFTMFVCLMCWVDLLFMFFCFLNALEYIPRHPQFPKTHKKSKKTKNKTSQEIQRNPKRSKKLEIYKNPQKSTLSQIHTKPKLFRHKTTQHLHIIYTQYTIHAKSIHIRQKHERK